MLLVASGSSLLTVAACQVLFGIDEDSLRGPSSGSAGVGAGSGSAGIGGSAVGGSSGGSAGTGGSAGIDGSNGNAGSNGTGGAPGCENGKVACGADCRDVLGNDADNCGACDRSCAGSSCKAGLCEPQVVVSGEVAPYALAQNNDSLFWVSPARKQDGSLIPRVRSVVKGPAGFAQNLIPNSDVRARSLAFFEGFLYWGTLGNDPSDTAGQRLARGAPDDAGGILVAPGQLNIQHLAAGATDRIYWTSLNDSAVRGINVTGGSIDPEVTSQGTVGWVTVDRDNQDQLYWVRSDTKQVRRQVLGSPNPTTTFEPVATANAPVSVELGNGRVYWADRVPGTIQSAPTGDLAAVNVEFQNQGTVEGFALAGTSLVVITLADDGLGTKVFRVWRKNEGREPFLLGQVPIIDSTVTYLNGNPFGAAHVLVDETFVYFADVGTLVGKSNGVDLSLGNGIIYRVAK
jgi:hypothetical protein